MPGRRPFQHSRGDSLNLQSVLSQYVFAALAGKPELWRSGEIVCDAAADLCGCTISWNSHHPAAAEKGRAGRLTK